MLLLIKRNKCEHYFHKHQCLKTRTQNLHQKTAEFLPSDPLGEKKIAPGIN